MVDDRARERKFRRIILAYPLALIAVAVLADLLWFGVGPLVPSLPGAGVMAALIVAGALLLANHTWLMTSTELTRLHHKAHATPEEWSASGRRAADMTEEARAELDRRYNAHRNATENTVLFVLLAGVFALSSPPWIAALVWIIGYGLARLGYSYAYLSGRDGLRGICMSLSLLPLYGMAGYLLLALARTA